MAAKKKATRKSSSKVLKVDSPSKIPGLEKILKQGKMTIVLVFADWCGHCHKFQKDIWEPMCKKNALHNRVAVRDDMLQKTSLANTKFNYLPSVLVVNEKGEPETFTTPDGEATNAMPTPKNQQDMEKIVNVPVYPSASPAPTMSMNGSNTIARMSPVETLEPLTNSSATMEANVNALGTPQGQTYKPMVMEQKGGAFYETMRQVSQGIFPIAILGGLSYALKGGASKRRKTHKKRRMIRA
jgi:hypothetical protein